MKISTFQKFICSVLLIFFIARMLIIGSSAYAAQYLTSECPDFREVCGPGGGGQTQPSPRPSSPRPSSPRPSSPRQPEIEAERRRLEEAQRRRLEEAREQQKEAKNLLFKLFLQTVIEELLQEIITHETAKKQQQETVKALEFEKRNRAWIEKQKAETQEHVLFLQEIEAEILKREWLRKQEVEILEPDWQQPVEAEIFEPDWQQPVEAENLYQLLAQLEAANEQQQELERLNQLLALLEAAKGQQQELDAEQQQQNAIEQQLRETIETEFLASDVDMWLQEKFAKSQQIAPLYKFYCPSRESGDSDPFDCSDGYWVKNTDDGSRQEDYTGTDDCPYGNPGADDCGDREMAGYTRYCSDDIDDNGEYFSSPFDCHSGFYVWVKDTDNGPGVDDPERQRQEASPVVVTNDADAADDPGQFATLSENYPESDDCPYGDPGADDCGDGREVEYTFYCPSRNGYPGADDCSDGYWVKDTGDGPVKYAKELKEVADKWIKPVFDHMSDDLKDNLTKEALSYIPPVLREYVEGTLNAVNNVKEIAGEFQTLSDAMKSGVEAYSKEGLRKEDVQEQIEQPVRKYLVSIGKTMKKIFKDDEFAPPGEIKSYVDLQTNSLRDINLISAMSRKLTRGFSIMGRAVSGDTSPLDKKQEKSKKYNPPSEDTKRHRKFEQ